MARGQNGKTLGKREIEVIDIGKLERRAAPDLPDCVEPGTRGAVEWGKIWEACPWLYPDQDYHWVEQIASLYNEVEVYRAQIAEDGLTVEGYNGQTTAHPLIKEMRAAQAQINKALSTLGISPSDRARLKLTDLQGAKLERDIIADIQRSQRVSAEVVEYNEDDW